MEQICKTKAESFICAYDEFFEVGVDDNERDARVSFSLRLKKMYLALDCLAGLGENGPYMKAIELGLNEYLLQLFMFEIRAVKQFFQRGVYLSIVGPIVYSLFYRKRSVGNRTVRCIDGFRVKTYVRSNEKAFESWFAASLQAIAIFQTQGLDAFQRNDLDSFRKIEKVADDSVRSWAHVFVNKKAAKAILLGSSKEVDGAAKERAKWIIDHINVITNNFPSIELPVKRVMEIRTYFFTAVIILQMKEFGIDVEDFFQLLQVKGDKKFMYECVAFPMAEGALKKGEYLDENEKKQILQQLAMSSSEGERKTSQGN